jgi:hypothetical protein
LALATDHRRQPTAAEIDRRMCERDTAPGTPRMRERDTAPGTPHLHDEDREVQQLYEEIMRQTDPSLRP